MEQEEANEKIIPRKILLWITIVIAVGLILLSLLSIYFVFIYPENQVSQLGITNVTEKANFINQTRTTFISFFVLFAQILAGGAVAIGIYFGWVNLKVALVTLESNQNKARDELKIAQETLVANQENAQKNLEVAQEGQITERFTRAVDQLGAIDKDGNPAIEIRLGGIYALERIAHESKKDHWPIIEILTAYVRKNSPRKNWNIKVEEVDTQTKLSWVSATPLSLDENGKLKIEEVKILSKVKVPLDTIVKVSEDIQAILTVIRRRNSSYSHNKLDMQGTHLHKANLQGADLQETNLQGADLQEANLIGANLEEAILIGANLEGAWLEESILSMAKLEKANLKDAVLFKADFYNAWLSKANFIGANLNRAVFEGAFLRETIFIGANLIDANFRSADLLGTNLEKSHLIRANLEGAILMRAIFKEANLERANLQGTHFTEAKNLTVDQLSKAKTLYKAKLDQEKEAELREKGFGHLLDDEPERDET